MLLNKICSFVFLLSCAVAIISCGNSTNTDETKSLIDSLSNNSNVAQPSGNVNYALGMLIGQDFSKNFNANLSNLNVDELMNALRLGISDSVSTQKSKDAMMAFNQEVQKNGMALQNGGKATFSSKFSINAGLTYGSGIKSMGFTSDIFKIEDFKKGFLASMGSGTPEMDMPTAQAIFKQETDRLMSKVGEKNLLEGKKFLEENAKKNPKIKTTASGIQYEILKEGNGPKPKATDRVTTHYHGTKIDGTVFDSSVERGQPSEFELNKVIKGWTEILQLMPKGSKWKVYIPAELAYGSRGNGGIAPNSTLIFEIELFKINGK